MKSLWPLLFRLVLLTVKNKRPERTAWGREATPPEAGSRVDRQRPASAARTDSGRWRRRTAASPLTLLRPWAATRCWEPGAGKAWEGTFSILGPRPGPLPGSATKQARRAGPQRPHRLLRLRRRAEAKPPTHFRGRQGSGAPWRSTLTAGEVGAESEGRSGGWGGGAEGEMAYAEEAHAQLVSGPKFQHHREMTAFCWKISGWSCSSALVLIESFLQIPVHPEHQRLSLDKQYQTAWIICGRK